MKIFKRKSRQRSTEISYEVKLKLIVLNIDRYVKIIYVLDEDFYTGFFDKAIFVKIVIIQE